MRIVPLLSSSLATVGLLLVACPPVAPVEGEGETREGEGEAGEGEGEGNEGEGESGDCVERCDGNVAVDCDNGDEVRHSCIGNCGFDGAEVVCNDCPRGDDVCNGDVLESCVDDGDFQVPLRASRDCAAEGLVCENSGCRAASPLDGFGVISGPCGVLADEPTSVDPSFFGDTAIEFADGFVDPDDVPRLTAGGQEMLADGNAGGSSILSEVFAYEVLARCEGATLIKTETEIQYTQISTKITDFTVNIGGQVVGVNPVRTFVFGPDPTLTPAEAQRRLEGKLDDVLISSANVAPADAWVKQIIVVIAAQPDHVPVVREVWNSLDAETRHDTIVYVMVTNGADQFIVD